MNAPMPEGAALRQLIDRCCAGDDSAQASLVLAYRDLIQRAVARKLTQFLGAPAEHAEVADISSEVWAHLLRDNCRALATLHHPERINGWLCVLAGNRTMDYLRRIGAQRRAETAFYELRAGNNVPAPRVALEDAERLEAARSLLAALSPEERLVLQLFFLEGRKYAEIAEVLGLNVNTIASRIRRAKLALRSQFAEQHDV